LARLAAYVVDNVRQIRAVIHILPLIRFHLRHEPEPTHVEINKLEGRNATVLYNRLMVRSVRVAYNDTDVMTRIYHYLHNAWAQPEPVDEEEDNENKNGEDNDSE